jgi:hypothetical protein
MTAAVCRAQGNWVYCPSSVTGDASGDHFEMKTFIYYPGMEVRDELWLKFALLWLERLAFVFTLSEQSRLPPLLDLLTQQSNLLAHSPSAADFDAITPRLTEQLGTLLAPSFVRHRVFGNKALIDRWQQGANHDCFCPAQAGLTHLHQYCLGHGLASQDEGGIRMARRLANLLSMYLAREWALTHDGILITDHDYLDRLLHLAESRYQPQGGQECFHLEIGLRLPAHLGTLPFDTLLAKRRHPDFTLALTGFHEALATLIKGLEEGGATPPMLTAFARARDLLEDEQLDTRLSSTPQAAAMAPLVLPLTLLISTAPGAAHQLSRLQATNAALARPLVFHPIKKSHFLRRKSLHGFTRLGQIRHG